ncbi:aldo/keto reductase [Planctomonas psychrotolerans]|uniref:aldo/keto reductase n=1 Tax=Planctomonas psychrotolerans TaxID=2528712 RepID=UPI001239B809|nr:aldo/keto reductase [Planctomonas psychrotolerans]
MHTRTTARGVEVTELGLGTAQLGNLFRSITDEEATAVVDAAWDGGIRYFDTAPHYGVGLSERRLGDALRDRPRDEYVLSTKVGRLLVPSPETASQTDPENFAVPADPRREWDLTADGVRRSIEESLERLDLDRIDIAYLHDPDDFGDQAVAEALPALIALRDEGVVRAVGAGMNQTAMLARFIREVDIDVVLCAGRLTLVNSEALDELLPLATERGVRIVAGGAYNSGLLGSERPSAEARYNYAPAPAELLERANQIADICEIHGATLPEAALDYPLNSPTVISVLVGAHSAAEVESNLARFGARVPVGVWTDLAAAGLIPEGFPRIDDGDGQVAR